MIEFTEEKASKITKICFLANILVITGFIIIFYFLGIEAARDDYLGLVGGLLFLCLIVYGLVVWLPLTILSSIGLQNIRQKDILKAGLFAWYGIIIDVLYIIGYLSMKYRFLSFYDVILFSPIIIHAILSLIIIFVVRNTKLDENNQDPILHSE